jgi:hypothetical protein
VVLPSAVGANSRSLQSALTAWVRDIDSGKLVNGVKVFAICNKRGGRRVRHLGAIVAERPILRGQRRVLSN